MNIQNTKEINTVKNLKKFPKDANNHNNNLSKSRTASEANSRSKNQNEPHFLTDEFFQAPFVVIDLV